MSSNDPTYQSFGREGGTATQSEMIQLVGAAELALDIACAAVSSHTYIRIKKSVSSRRAGFETMSMIVDHSLVDIIGLEAHEIQTCVLRLSRGDVSWFSRGLADWIGTCPSEVRIAVRCWVSDNGEYLDVRFVQA